jgi:hypothetical protein
MRRIAFFLLLVSSSFQALAQNWKTVALGDTAYYLGDGSLRNLRVMWVDSVVALSSGDSQFCFYKAIRPNDTFQQCMDYQAPSWLGRAMYRTADGMDLYINRHGDTIRVNTLANLGESWAFMRASDSLIFSASVVDQSTRIVNGALDSTKTLELAALYNGNPIANDHAGKQLTWSKNNGWLTTYDLYYFDSAYAEVLPFSSEPLIFYDSSLLFRLPKSFKDVNIRDSTPFERYIPGNYWIQVREHRSGLNLAVDYSIYTFDSVKYATLLPNGTKKVVFKSKKITIVPGAAPDITNAYTRVDTVQLPTSFMPIRDTALPFYNHFIGVPDSLTEESFSQIEESYSRFLADTFCDGSHFQYVWSTPNSYIHVVSDSCLAEAIPLAFSSQSCSISFLTGFGLLHYGCFEYDEIGAQRSTLTTAYARLGACEYGTLPDWETLGVTDMLSNSGSTRFGLYPNPANSHITIAHPNGHQSGICTIADLSGRVAILVSFSAGATTEIDVSNLPRGMYLITVATDLSRQTEKLVIQ